MLIAGTVLIRLMAPQFPFYGVTKPLAVNYESLGPRCSGFANDAQDCSGTLSALLACISGLSSVAGMRAQSLASAEKLRYYFPSLLMAGDD